MANAQESLNRASEKLLHVCHEHEQLAGTDFDQSDFGHPYWPTLAKPTLARKI